MKVKGISEIEFFFDREGKIKGVAASYKINPLLKRVGRLGRQGKYQTNFTVGDCSFHEVTIF